MFHWICPECGRETAPTERECPACEGLEQAELVLAGVVEASASTLSSDAGVPKASHSDASSKGESPDPPSDVSRASQLQEGSADSGNHLVSVPKAEDDQSQGDAEKGINVDAEAETPAAGIKAEVVTELPHGPSLVGLSELERNTALFVEAANDTLAADVPASHDLQLRLDAAAKVLAEASETALIPEIVDPATFVSHMMETKSAALLGARAQAPEHSSGARAQAPEHMLGASTQEPEQVVRSIRTKTVESRSVDARSVDARSVDIRSVDTWTVGSKPAASKFMDIKPVDAKVVEARPAEASPVDVRPLAEIPYAASTTQELPLTHAAPADAGSDVPAPAGESAGAKSEEKNPTPSQAAGPVPFSKKLNRVLQAAGMDLRGRRGRSAVNLPPAPPKQDPTLREQPPVDAAAIPASGEAGLVSGAIPGVASEDVPNPTASLRALNTAVSNTEVEEKIEEKIEENVPAVSEPHVPEQVSDVARSLSEAPAAGSETPAAGSETLAAGSETLAAGSETPAVDESAASLTPSASASSELPSAEPAAAELKADAVEAATPAAEPATSPEGTSLELLAEGLPLRGKMAMPANPAVAASKAVAAPLAIAGPPEQYLLAAPSQDQNAHDQQAILDSAALANQPQRPEREPALVKLQMRLTMPVAPVVANNPAQSMVPEVEAAPAKDLAQAPDIPARSPSPRMGRLLRYSPIAKRTIIPAAPSWEPTKTSVEVTGTIPGPVLPAALVSFQDPELKPQFLEQATLRKSSSWGQLFLVALLGIGLGLGVHYLYVSYMHPAEAEADVSDNSAPASTPVAAAAPSMANGFTKSMEVTGFRIVMDPTRKTEIHYIVVNHSGIRFPDAKVNVTLYSTDARVGQPPLCRFSFAAPNLGPFEAKEMASSLDSSPAGNPPEWRDLRAEISVGQ